MEKFYVKVEERHCNSPDCRGVCDAMYLASEADARIAELQRICRIAYEDGMQGGAPLKASTLELLKSCL